MIIPDSQTWRARDGVQRAYGYVYDPVNRLLQGDYVARALTPAAAPNTGSWNTEQDRYRLSFASYDDNGNLLTLRRRGLLANATHAQAKQFGPVDQLLYTYAGNRLQAVDDQVRGNQLARPFGDNGAPTSLAGDFQEGGTQQGTEYLYDANGNLTQDRNKGITGIGYNHLNLPRQIHFGIGADSVVFRYTAAGQKVGKLVYQTGKPTVRTDYLGPFQYEGDSLRFFPHAEGRVLRFASTDAAGQTTVRYEREFSFKDHLGNLRLAYRLGHVRTLTTSLNLDDASGHAREAQQFDSLSVSAPVAQRVGTLARSDQFAARLNAGGTAPQPLGPLAQLAVQQGDTVTVTAYGLYTQPVQHNLLFPLASFLTSLLHPAQGLPAAGPDPLHGQAGLPLLQVGVATGLASLPQLPGGVPKGYLRVLVFSADSALVRQYSQQLSGAALNSYQALRQRVVVGQDGYVSAFVGNESDGDVLFDDMSVEHRPGVQVQEVEYDPAGLELAGLGTSTPGLKSLSQYKFNGKEFQADLGLNWNHQDWRFLDGQLGRWHGVDQLAEKWQTVSPYCFASNNPVLVADPDGRDNIIYLQAQKSAEQDLSRKELRSIVRQANTNFKELGLETRVRLAKGNVNYNKLDKTDAVAVIGRGSDIISTVDKMNKGFANELREVHFGSEGSLSPERSQNDAHGGNIIALDSRAIKATAKEWHETSVAVGAFVINHGAGHNAGLEHGGTDQMSNGAGMLRVPAVSVMTDGQEIYNSVMHLNGWGYTPGLNGFINNPSNDHGLIHESYLQRFGSNKAKATLPTE